MGHPSFDYKAIASQWLSRFAHALQTQDPHATSQSFVHNGWLRESQIFTWDNRTLQGRERIYQHLSHRLPQTTVFNFQIDNRQYLSPERGQVTPNQDGVVSGFTFETDSQWGQGYLQLLLDADNVWKAFVVYMMATDIKGHEESTRETGIYGNHTVAWGTVLGARRKEIEENPQALIIGASQTGVMIAARFKQMNIPALLIDTQSRLGDTWRKRYDSLTLHTPRMHDHFLYHRFPQNWPLFTPKDKVADWIEHYAISQDLTVWLNSQPAENSVPIYDENAKRWTITIDRAGQHVTLHPAHIVVAIGTIGSRIMPSVSSRDAFKGIVIHGGDYKNPTPFVDKRVVVVGAGNTAGDICLDLSVCAKSITMVQRSKTSLVPIEIIREIYTRGWPDDGSIPTEISDFKSASVPVNLLRLHSRMTNVGGGKKNAELYNALREKGMMVDDGEEGEGILFQVLEKYSGFMLDVGCSKLILSGRVQVKPGVEIASFKEESVIFTDGTEIDADAVIFATGYKSVYDNIVSIFGKGPVDRAGNIWGIDEEGELRNVYRPTGHPALWYGAGGFQTVRYGSKQLAMLIKAAELGLRN